MVRKETIRVRADSNQMKKIYSKLSKIYGFVEKSEKKLRKKSLELLNLQKGDVVLEIGFGRGTTLIEIAKTVGVSGKVYGIDLTKNMVEITKKRLAKKGRLKSVELLEGDARNLPYEDSFFDAVYIASTLELFDTPDIPIVLKEIKRVLKPSGRLCVVSIPKENLENSFGVKFFEWSHRLIPKYSSCRPIYVEDSINNAGFIVLKTEIVGKFFPMKIVISKR